ARRRDARAARHHPRRRVQLLGAPQGQHRAEHLGAEGPGGDPGLPRGPGSAAARRRRGHAARRRGAGGRSGCGGAICRAVAAGARDATMRRVGVKCNVRGRDLGGFVAEAQRRVAAEVQLPPNSFLTWGGEFENQRRAMGRLAIIVPVSIGLILAILMRTFGSLPCALLILATIPFALVGGVVGLDVAGLNLSVSACIGFIALMGQVVLNGGVLVSQINALRAEGLGLGAAVEAGATRGLGAGLMVALLAGLD